MSQILDIFICMCSQQVHLLVMLRHDRFIINSSLFNKTLIYIRDILHAFIYIYIYRTSNNFAKYIFIVCNKKMKDMIIYWQKLNIWYGLRLFMNLWRVQDECTSYYNIPHHVMYWYTSFAWSLYYLSICWKYVMVQTRLKGLIMFHT